MSITSRLLSPHILALVALCSLACQKPSEDCVNSSQCADGFVCGDEGACEASATGAADAGAPNPDADHSCPVETHGCVAAVPEGWSGPVVGAASLGDEAPAQCAGEFPIEEKLVFAELVAEGTCTCDCAGTATGVSCSGAVLMSTGLCGGGCFVCPRQTLPAHSCVPLDDDVHSRPNLMVVSHGGVTNSGQCSNGVVTIDSNFQAEFSNSERYCSGASSSAVCPSGGLCLANARADFTATCIYQEGDLECPEQFPAKALRYDGLSDERSCSSCSCGGAALGSSCGGKVETGVYFGDCFVEQEITSSSISCTPRFDTSAPGGLYTPSDSIECAAVGGEVQGEVALNGETTFCCTAPPEEQ